MFEPPRPAFSESPLPGRPPQSPAELLRPQAEAVPFHGREERFGELRGWCQGEGLSTLLITGPGGQGKTRFVREFARPASTRTPDDTLAALSAREREVFLLIARGLSNAEIAEAAFLGEATVKTHVRQVLQKLGLKSRVQVVAFAYEHELMGARR